jgi:3-phenylpropionate/trans-cinnamate dioxygenase ferredoxin reductase subunit
MIIVGAGQAGVQIAESLRQEGYAEAVTLIGAEAHAPYYRPPLSKKWLAQPGTLSSLSIRSLDWLARRNIELKLGTSVEAIERERHELRLSDGARLPYRGLALATGALTRHLPPPASELRGVFTLRSLEDSQRVGAQLRRCAQDGLPVVVIGGGFIGLEAAAMARHLGAEVTVLEALSRLMSRVLAPIVSDAFAQLHAAHGVNLVMNANVSRLLGVDGEVRAVHTTDGKEYPAGCVIVGIGVLPDDRLAAAAGLACERGIIVDDYARTDDPAIVAAGDCTARRQRGGGLVRLESVNNAVEQGKSAAAALLGRARPLQGAPWFWSDQHGVKLQMVGLSHGYDEVVTRGDLAKPAFSAYYFRAGRLVAVDSLNRVHEHMMARKLLDQEAEVTPARAADADFDLQQLLREPTTPAAPG